MKPNEHDQHAKILVVDDEPQITRVLRTALSTQGYSLRIAANGVEGMEAMHTWKPDLVITDVAMPEMGGVELCREIRAVSQVPIIVLSVRNQDQMKIEALDAGADDYVTKPFSIQELQARVRAQLRRTSPAGTETPKIIQAGDFLIDIPQHRVVVRGQDTHLTPKQFDLLVVLAQQPGRVLTHRALLHAVWGTNADQPEYLRVTIGQLRKKIELSDEPAYIVTEPWVGYRFRPTGNDSYQAIEAASAAGGGTELFPTGTWLCFSIRLTILAADSPLPGAATGYNGGTYDAAEPNIPWDAYQVAPTTKRSC